ncbi:MAG: LysR family transcriptional regulator [Hyphomicrobium sp.]|uniref:LysR family transcriptional regulator n=1 Tax=Hyphomicrobium sp. TaxID=82 RepID=UPI0039E2CA86
MDRFEAMSVLLAVTDAGSLSAGARRLGMPLATVSRKVSELEAHLHTRLLNRGSRRLELTDAGQSYVAACRKILEDVVEAERTASGEYRAPRGELAITAPIVFGRLHLLPIVGAFLRAYSEIDVRVTLSDRVVNILEEHVDVALRIGDLPDSSLVAARVGSIRRVVCASPSYLDARGIPESPNDLATHDCITFEGLMSPRSWTFWSNGQAQTVPVHSRLVVNTAEAAIDMAVSGIGITRVLSYQIAAPLADRKIAIVLSRFEPAPLPVSLVYTGNGLLPLKLRAFLDFATPRLKASLVKSGDLTDQA